MRRYVPLFQALLGLGNPAARAGIGARGVAWPPDADLVEVSADGVEWFAVGPVSGAGIASNDERAGSDSAFALLRTSGDAAPGGAVGAIDAAVPAPAPGALVLMVGGVLATGNLRSRRGAGRRPAGG